MNTGNLINLKDDQWLGRQKIAGQVVAEIHKHFGKIISSQAKITLRELEELADVHFRNSGCTPTFYKYRGFPGKICTSINHTLVHGIPTDYRLEPGDIVKIDIGATYEGAIGDCAFTYVYGKVKNERIGKMLIACQEALLDSIKSIEVGKPIGIIGNTIFNKSKQAGFGVIEEYGGHGIDYDVLHASPFIPNKSRSNEGIVAQTGLSIAIEPMFVLGQNTKTKLDKKDGWSVITRDIGCHYEHSVTIDSNGEKHIITDHMQMIKDMI